MKSKSVTLDQGFPNWRRHNELEGAYADKTTTNMYFALFIILTLNVKGRENLRGLNRSQSKNFGKP